MPRSRTRNLVTSALLAALLAASALVAIPVGAVPVTLQTLVVVLISLVCTPTQAAVTLGLYLALGAAGAPVFSGGQGGLAALAGPTGGYLVGFALGAALGAGVRAHLTVRAPARDAIAAVVVLAVVYTCGALWLAASTESGVVAALAAGVVPFLPLDALKTVGALAVAAALRRAGLADTPPGTASVW